MGKQLHSFSEFKRDAVGRVADGKRPLTQVARERDVHPHLLQVWRKKYGTPKQAESVPQDGKSLEDEVRRLRRENAGLREDRDILKKVYCYTEVRSLF